MWTLDYADARFSKWIIARDGKCQHPYCNMREPLDCSHFYIRSHSATRYDPENCIALCRRHHEEWGIPVSNKNPEYKMFMLQRLGAKRYTQLTQRANSIMNRGMAIMALMGKLSQGKL